MIIDYCNLIIHTGFDKTRALRYKAHALLAIPYTAKHSWRPHHYTYTCILNIVNCV